MNSKYKEYLTCASNLDQIHPSRRNAVKAIAGVVCRYGIVNRMVIRGGAVQDNPQARLDICLDMKRYTSMDIIALGAEIGPICDWNFKLYRQDALDLDTCAAFQKDGILVFDRGNTPLDELSLKINKNVDTFHTVVNLIASQVAELIYSTRLDALSATLHQYHVEPQRYALMMPKDRCVCLVFRDGQWVVYNCENWNESGTEPFPELDAACAAVLWRLAESEEAYQKMYGFLQEQLSSIEERYISPISLYEAIRESVVKLRRKYPLF